MTSRSSRLSRGFGAVAAVSLAALAASACDTDGTDGTDGDDGNPIVGEPAAVKGITEAHNQVRANVDPAATTPLPPLVWDQALGDVAQAYADACNFEHSMGKYGENLYASSGNTPPAEVVKSWADEVAEYDYATNGCSGVCGHYTQVVWADSTKLGCGVANCTENSPFGAKFPTWQLWVCNYDPPGNFVGKKPY